MYVRETIKRFKERLKSVLVGEGYFIELFSLRESGEQDQREDDDDDEDEGEDELCQIIVNINCILHSILDLSTTYDIVR